MDLVIRYFKQWTHSLSSVGAGPQKKRQVTNLEKLFIFNIVLLNLIYGSRVSGKEIHSFHKQKTWNKMF